MSSQNNDGIEYTIQENDKKETSEVPVEQPIPKGNALNDLPPEVRSQLPESFGQTINHSDAYIEFLKKHKDSKEITSNGGGFNGHPKDYLDFLAKQNK
jgi:hypothetical protein